MSAMVRVVVRPDDVEGVPLGGKSAAGTVSITAEYDRTVELTDGTIRYAGVRTPLHKSTVLDYWQIDVIAADADDIVRGAGCCVTFRVEVTPRHGGGQGRGHGQAVTTHAKTIQVVTADGILTNLASKASVVPVPEGAVLIDPGAVMKAGEAWDKADNAENIATGAVTAAQAAQHAAEIAEGAAFATVDSGTAELISNPVAGPQTTVALEDWISLNARPIDPTAPSIGAKGDGSTDDTTALNAALAAGPVDLNGRTYKINGTLTVPSGGILAGTGPRKSVLYTNSDNTVITHAAGGQAQVIRNVLIRSWFTGARTKYELDFTNMTKLVMEDVEIDGAAGMTGTSGIRFKGDNGLAGNHFMPQLSRVWVRNGRVLIDGVSDGHMSDCYVWANNNPDIGAITLQNVADGWSFNNVDAVPGTAGGAAYSFANTNNVIITGGYADGSYETVMTGYGIRAVNSGRIFVSGWRAYNLGRGGIYLQNTHGCEFIGVGFHRNNKADNSYPDIDLISSTGNRFVTTHTQNVSRANRGAVYREDAASTKNDFPCTVDTSLGNYYGTPLISANAGTLNPRSKPESILPRNSSAPNIIVPPASTFALPAATAWPAAEDVIAHRFHVQQGAVYSQANFRIDTAASSGGLVQVAILKMSGTSWTKVTESGAVADTAGDRTISITAAYLEPGEYALAVWVNNATTQIRWASSTGLSSTRAVAGWNAPGGIGASGTLTWNGLRYLSGLTLANP